MKNALVLGSLAAAVIAVVGVTISAEDKPKSQPSEEAIARTRDVVKMLDDIYKNAIVLITDKYVNTEDDFPAGSAAVELFRRVAKTGFYNVRLIDVTGEPYEAENVAKNDFEKRAAKQIKAGKSSYEEVTTIDGEPYLQTMTAVPVVMKKCIMCHPHYADVKEGAAIGAISYELPIR